MLKPKLAAAKPATNASPVSAALAAPLSTALEAATNSVEAARRAAETAAEMLAEARSDERKVAVDGELARIQAALQRAHAKREVAERLGDDDAPGDKEIAELEDAFILAKKKSDSYAPKIEGLKHECSRRRELLREAVDALHNALRPFEESLSAAIAQQVQMAADMLGEAQAAERIRANLGDLPYGPVLRSVPGGRDFTGTVHAPASEALRNAYDVSRRGDHEARRKVD